MKASPIGKYHSPNVSETMSLSSTGCDFCSGWIAGMAGLLVGHPIDTLKVRQQILGKRMLESIGNIYKAGGVLTFFRGMGAPLVSTGAMNSVYFGFYGTSLDYLTHWRNQRIAQSNVHKVRIQNDGETQSKPHLRRHQDGDGYWIYFVSGCIGGAAQLVIACPVDLVKVQLQSHLHRGSVRGPIECAARIVSAKGPFGLYKGLVIQAWRDIPSSGIYFMLYEFLKKKLSLGKEESTKLAQFMAGGIAGIVSWWSILPLDVIKSRIQSETSDKPKYRGIAHCTSVILKTNGVSGLFRGFLPLSLRAFPVNGTTFLVYEYLFGHCKEYQSSLYS